jgi:hypothetical protein
MVLLLFSARKCQSQRQHLSCLLILIKLTNYRLIKLLPKSGPDFDRFVQHLKSIKLPEEAAKYSQLQNTIIQHRLQSLDLDRYSVQGTQIVNSVITAPIVSPFPDTLLDLGYPGFADMEDSTWCFILGDETVESE